MPTLDVGELPTPVQGVLIVDITQPWRPVVIGRAGTPGIASDVAPFERDGTFYIAVADGLEGVRIFDVTDAAVPRTVAVFDPSGGRAADVRAVDVAGDLLAVADGERGFAVVDLTTVSAPTLVGSGYAGRAAIDIAFHRGLVYVSHFPGFIDVYDARIPGLPRVGGLMACETCMQRYPARLHLVGDELFVTSARDGVRTYALDGAGRMTQTALRPTPGPAFAVVATTDRLYVGEEGGLVTFDRGSIGAPRSFDPTGHGVAGSVSVVGGLAYVAAASRGLQVFDLEAPEAPALVGRVDTPASTSGDVSAAFVTATSSMVFVGDGRGSLVTFDVATRPTVPTLAAQLVALDGVESMALAGDGLAVVCEGNTGIMIADVAEPAAPKVITHVRFTELDPTRANYCLDTVVDDATRLAYIATIGGIVVLDVGDPANTRLVGRHVLPAGDAVSSLARSGSLLYATTRVSDFEGDRGVISRLQTFDLAVPEAPRHLWASADLGIVGDLTLVGDLAFVAAGDLGVYIFELANPAEPTLQLLVPTTGPATALAATADALYVAQSAGGLGVIHTGALPVGR